MGSNYTNVIRDYSPAEMFPGQYAAGVLVDLDAEHTSIELDANGANQISVDIVYDRGVGAGATTVSAELDYSHDGGASWFTVQSGTAAGGVITLQDAIWRHAVVASDNWGFNVGGVHPMYRVRITSAGGIAGQDRAAAAVRFTNT